MCFYSSLLLNLETAHHMVRGSVESLQLASIFSTHPRSAKCMAAALVEVVITSILDGHDRAY